MKEFDSKEICLEDEGKNILDVIVLSTDLHAIIPLPHFTAIAFLSIGVAHSMS